MRDTLVSLACKLYALMEWAWNPFIQPKSPVVRAVDLVRSSCWYCTSVRVFCIGFALPSIFVGWWVIGLGVLGGVTFIVVVERLAQCKT